MVSLVATQNVDGFHKLAGNQRVGELQGSIRSISLSSLRKSCSNGKFFTQRELCTL
ncbi:MULTISPECIES: Sir2 family NAD-dependent protein deacetylase [unclassified Lysinibacillus]|uniref:Sir2 family NAD-dependent protein deacetylase n=1 Tax=unclassified Lysinibacillus TaxID=2636778 RepID=UPI0020CA8F28|nr:MULTISPECIES: Sir2 family NAD-dependent protein deacetylase [unclassified Lysinibacillus]